MGLKNLTDLVSLIIIITICYSRVCFTEAGAESLVIYKQDINDTKEAVSESGEDFIRYNNDLKAITCESSVPIEWNYRGEGSPSKVMERSARMNESHVVSYLSFNFQAPGRKASEDDIYDYVQHTGFYVCQEVNRTANNASVYVYFSDYRAPLLSNEYTATPLIKAEIVNGTQDTQRRAKYSIPCVPTNPSVELSLHVEPSSGESVTFSSKSLPENVTFDPKKGFTFDILLLLFKQHEDEYLCTARRSSKRVESKFFTVQLNSTPRIRAFPPERVIYVAEALNLTCESAEPVRIQELWSDAPASGVGRGSSKENITSSEDVEETTEITPSDKHVANFYDPHPVLGTSGEFNCITDNNQSEVLHTWQSFIVGGEKLNKSGIRYSKKKKEFRCRTQLDEPGFLSYINCVNPSECNINKQCFDKSFRCRGYGDLILNWCSEEPKCKKLIHIHEKGRGFVRCLSLEADGIDDVKEFDESGILQTSRVELEPEPQLMIDSAITSPDKNDTALNVTLIRPTSRYISGHQWHLTYKIDGASKTEQIYPTSETEYNDFVSTTFELTPNQTSTYPLELICKVPQRDSMEWKIVSVKSADEILIEQVSDIVTSTSTSES